MLIKLNLFKDKYNKMILFLILYLILYLTFFLIVDHVLFNFEIFFKCLHLYMIFYQISFLLVDYV